MPIYIYRCSNCGVQFDKQQSFTDQTLVRCPECGKKTLKKVFQPVGIVFKGSGFYATDHHSPSGQQSMKESTKEDEKGDRPEKKEPAAGKEDGIKPASPKAEATTGSKE